MAVGQGSLLAGLSYFALGRESTLGTYNTCTAYFDILSSSLKTMKETKVLEQIEFSRSYSKQIKMGKKIEGDVEFYFYPQVTSCAWVLQNVLGGTVTSATATGETAGGTAFTHTYKTGAMDQTYKSLCVNLRKGPSSTGKIFEYSGLRINTLEISSQLDDALKMSMGLVGMDSSLTTNDVESVLTATAYSPLSFVGGRLSVESTFASLTSSSFWHIQSFALTINNNLKTDNEARRIGSDILTTLPVGMQTFECTVSMRFDTSTAFDAMINNTEFSMELEFQGDTMSTSVIKEGLKLQFPSIRIHDAGDPELGGPDEILMSEVTFQIMRDDSSATGYAIRALLTNQMSSI